MAPAATSGLTVVAALGAAIAALAQRLAVWRHGSGEFAASRLHFDARLRMEQG